MKTKRYQITMLDSMADELYKLGGGSDSKAMLRGIDRLLTLHKSENHAVPKYSIEARIARIEKKLAGGA